MLSQIKPQAPVYQLDLPILSTAFTEDPDYTLSHIVKSVLLSNWAYTILGCIDMGVYIENLEYGPLRQLLPVLVLSPLDSSPLFVHTS